MQCIRSSRRLAAALFVPTGILMVAATAFVAAESLVAAAVLVATVGLLAWWAKGTVYPVLTAHATDGVVELSGAVADSVAGTVSGPFETHTVGGVPAALPRGWSGMVATDDALDAQAVVVALGGEPDVAREGYVVTRARRCSDGAALSVAEEVAAGGGLYHAPNYHAVGPALWLLGAAVAGPALVIRAAGDPPGTLPGESMLGLASAGVAMGVTLLALAMAFATPFVRSRSRVEAYRDRTGLHPAAQRWRQRAAWSGGAAVLAAMVFGASAPLVGVPVWVGALGGAALVAPVLWLLHLPPPRLRP